MEDLSNLVSGVGFDESDFIHSRSKSVAGVEDILVAVEIYRDYLNGDHQEKKRNGNKVRQIESSMTIKGLKKLNDIRKTLRMRKEELSRERQRMLTAPPVTKSGIDFDLAPLLFMNTMQEWGEYPSSDQRYYLHMVFRFYLKDYHDHAVRAYNILPHPSYQYILDALYPNDSASKFPPEFRRFLIDAGGRSIEIRSLPVPVKGSPRNVSYENNFESMHDVSTMRRKIESKILAWKALPYSVYPNYLLQTNPLHVHVLRGESYARKVTMVSQGLRRLQGCVSSECFVKVQQVCEEVPSAATIYEEYMSHRFRSKGEQLDERLGFFTVPKYAKVFSAIDEYSLVEQLFRCCGASLEVFALFKAFCKKQVGVVVEKDESLRRSCLMVIVDVCTYLFVVKNSEMAKIDPKQVMRDTVKEVSEKAK